MTRKVVVKGYSGLSKWELASALRSKLKPDDVEIAVFATGVSYVDILVALGKYQIKPPLPYTPGTEFSGMVLSVGSNVRDFAPGDRVLAGAMGGGFAETCVTPSNFVKKIPASLSYQEASVLRVSYNTALHALAQRAKTAAGETVLVLGASGAIGCASIQVAKALGGRVIASTTSLAKSDFLRECGADEVLDASHSDWRQKVKGLTAGRGVDIVIDPIGEAFTERAFRSLAWKGRHLVLGFVAGNIPALPVNLPLLKGASLIGVDVRQFAQFEPDVFSENLDTLFSLIDEERISVPLAATYELSEFKDAIAHFRSGDACGRILLTPNSNTSVGN